MSYDVLGRLIQRIDRKADNSIEANTTWTFDSAPNGIGQLGSVHNSIDGYTQAIEYDSFGRVAIVSDNADPSTANISTYKLSTYDQYGRPFQQIDYPLGAIQYVYNAQGYQSRIVDGLITDGVQKEYHATIQVTPRGQVAEARLGNGYSVIKTYDPETGRPTHIGSSLLGLFDNTLQDLSFTYDDLGNMLQRHDQSGTKNLVENFTYDSLNRLTSSQVVGRTAVNLSYDHFGNIISKSDIGTYTYV